MKWGYLIVLTVLLSSCGAAQEEKAERAEVAEPQAKQGLDEAKKALLATLEKEGVDADLKAQTISVAAVVNEPSDALEYLLIHSRGKGHEALFVTEVKPSLLNSAFILLGFKKGKNASYKDKVPPPTREEVEKGASWVDVFPPEGEASWMTVSWTDEEKKVHEVVVDDLLVDLHEQMPIRDNAWIYLGGNMAPLYRNEPPVFVADFEGNLVSICYMSPPNHLLTLRHERARDDQNWWKSELCPPPETKVRFTFHRRMPAVAKERAARIEKSKKAAGDGAGEKGAGKADKR